MLKKGFLILNRRWRIAEPLRRMELQEEHVELKNFLKDGRNRRLGPPSPRERGRKAVRNNIDRTIEKVERRMPEFANFLRRSIVANGTAFVYRPAPLAPKWIL